MTDTSIQVLLVDDDEDDYILTAELLSEVEIGTFELTWVDNYEEALTQCLAQHHDIFLFDYRLGEKTGLDLMRQLISKGCDVPMILLTGQGDKEVDLLAMEAGASDYLVKGQIDSSLIGRAIRYAVERKRSQDKIRQMAYFDSLTGLPNRVMLHDRLQQAIAVSNRYHRMAAVLFLDLDNFKRINDTLGHKAGDCLLQEVATRLNKSVRQTDAVGRSPVESYSETIARMGGDEFVLLLTELAHPEDAAKVSEQILHSLAKPFSLDGHEVVTTASIGIALYPNDGVNIEDLLKNADTAMYQAKNQGKNSFQYYQKSMNASAVHRLDLEANLRRALRRNEFILHFLPQVDIRTGKIVCLESLIRWQCPEEGLILPAKFIPIAEEIGLIQPIGEWVLNESCRQMKKWQQQNITTRVTVNVSPRQFQQGNIIKKVEEALIRSGLDPQYLELDITESLMIYNQPETIARMQTLKDMGVRLSMDDFGTGFCSFSFLKHMPIDSLKIDQVFLQGLLSLKENDVIISSIIAIAHSLNIQVIAEGVETEEQIEFLRKRNCDVIQGYFLSKPLPADKIPELLQGAQNLSQGIDRLKQLIDLRIESERLDTK